MDEVQFKIRICRERDLNPGLSAREIVARITDLLHYTATFGSDEYVARVGSIMNDMKRKNFTLAGGGFKNYWADESKNYKGIHVTWSDPKTEQLFELRLHTKDSFRIETAERHIYEEWKALDSVKHAMRILELEAQSKALWSSVTEPDDVRDLEYPFESIQVTRRRWLWGRK